MAEPLKYTIFRTSWGYFGMVGTESSLCRTCLPLPDREKVESQLLKNLSRLSRKSGSRGHEEPGVERQAIRLEPDRKLFEPLQGEVAAYFDGAHVDFSPDIRVAIDELSTFARLVLAACREVKFGCTTSYSRLAKKLNRPGGARAVGNALARNPLPLIIPCHRVVRSDGGMGGFTAVGGTKLKKKMLDLEQQAPTV